MGSEMCIRDSYYLYVKQKLKENSLKISLESNSLIKILQEALGGIRDIIIDGNQESYRNIFQRADLIFRKSLGSNLFISSSPRYIMETFGVLLIVLLAYMLSTQGEKSFADGIPVLGALALGAQRLLPVMQIFYNAWGNLKGTQGTRAGRETAEIQQRDGIETAERRQSDGRAAAE